jgi:hypothetical protein
MAPERELIERLEKLEKRALRTQQLVVVLVITLAGLMAILRLKPTGPIRATEFVLTDAHGAILAKLGYKDLETCLELGGGKPSSAHLCVGDQYGSDLYLSNRGGADRAFLSAGSLLREPGGTVKPGLVISEGDGKNLIAGSLGTDTRLIVGHANQENSVLLSSLDATLSIQVLGPSGKPLWKAP